MRRNVVLLLSLVFLLSVGSAFSMESRRILEHREDGAFLAAELREGGSAPADGFIRDDILWHRNQGDIFNATAIGNDASVFTGDYVGVAMHDLYGDGTPLWNIGDGDGNGTAGAANSDLFAAVTLNDAIAGATLRVFQAGSSTPLWTKDIQSCAAPYECLRINDDGSRVILGVNVLGGGDVPTVYTFDGPTGDIVSIYEGNPASYIRALEISDDGSLCAIRASADLHVIESETGTARWTGNAGASSDGLAFSGDGQWLASGWTFLLVWKWDGTAYGFEWSNNGGGSGWYLGRCAFSGDGGALVAGFYTTSYNQLRVMWWDPASSIPAWTYNSPLSSGVYQEIPSALDVSADGDYAVLGSWGDIGGVNPELHVFGPDGPDPLYTVDSPGSIFSAACRPGGTGIVASGCGKHVHANEFGSGGDLYVFEVGPPTDAPDAAATALRMAAYPNPFNPKVTLSVELASAGPLELAIYSADGRLLRQLAAGDFPAGYRQFDWDGKNAAGQDLPSGVYMARAKSAEGENVKRLVLMK